MENKKLSMIDIANLSGVSVATVSRVLNKNGRYSKETEKRVLDVINKYDYKINQSAKSLRTSKSYSIGVIVPDITNEFFAKIIRSIENNILPLGYTVIVCDSNEDENLENKHIANLVSRGVDGIIYISGKTDIKNFSKEYDIPVVYIDRRPLNAGSLVNSDNLNGGFLATEELIKKGCKKIILLSERRKLSTVTDRCAGYKKALEQYGIKEDKSLFVDANVSYEDTKAEMLKFIDSGTEFDGIFANNDMMAIATMHALRERNLKVPKDVRLVGFDGISLTEICNPPMTTIVQDTDKFGEISVRELIKKISNSDTDNIKEEDFIIPVKLAVRQTT